MGKKMESIEDAIEEMRRLKSKLPTRPSSEEVNYATQATERVDIHLTAQLEELFQQPTPPGVPYHVFRAYLEMREDLIRTKAQNEKRTAVGIIELEDRHQRFDALIQKAHSAALHPLHNNAVHEGSAYDYKQPGVITPDGSKHKSLPSVSEDTSYSAPLPRASSIGHLGGRSFKGSTSALKSDSAAISNSRPTITQEAPTPGSEPDPGINQDGVRQYSRQLLQAIDRAKDHGLEELKLKGMELEYIPEYIGNLTNLTSLDLSENRLKALPESICELSKLTILSIHTNQLKALPETIGCLTNLRILDMKHNKIEELPITIGLCTQLEELIADFNELKVLPEATGNLTSLQKLSIHLNHVQRLPTTLRSLTNLVELDVRFNQIERIPDSVCHLPKLAKLDVSSNFTELRGLPRDIGHMQSLRELYISSNQISMLPASFAKLTGLEKLDMDQNPWVVPPLDVVRRGKQAVLQFMIDLEAQESKDQKEIVKKPGLGSMLSSVFKKKKSSSSPYKVKSVNPLDMRA